MDIKCEGKLKAPLHLQRDNLDVKNFEIYFTKISTWVCWREYCFTVPKIFNQNYNFIEELKVYFV